MRRSMLLAALLGLVLAAARPLSAGRQGKFVAGTIPVKGGEIYYEEKGVGRPVVLLHAGLVDSRMWDGQFDLLAARRRVVRFDARGLGRSSLPAGDYSNYEDLHDVLVALGIKKATLVGLSLGGRTSIDFALAYPDMVDAIVAVAPGMSGWQFKDPVLVERSKRLQPAVEANDSAAFVDWFVSCWADGPRRTPDQVDKTVRDRVRQMGTQNMAKHGSLQQYFQRSARVQEVGAAKRIGDLRVPILAIVGDQDMADIHDIVDALVKGVPGTRKVVVPGAGHMVNMEKADEFNRLLLEFLSVK